MITPIPYGFDILADPSELFEDEAQRAAIVHNRGTGTVGLLLYGQCSLPTYVDAEKAILVFAYLLDQAHSLISACTEDFKRDYSEEVERFRSAWWSDEAEQARALAKLLGPAPKDQERPATQPQQEGGQRP